MEKSVGVSEIQCMYVSYIRKPRLSGNFLGNKRVRINEVSMYLSLSCGIKFISQEFKPIYHQLLIIINNVLRTLLIKFIVHQFLLNTF